MSDVLVLSYHAVSERWPAALSVTPSRLAEQLQLLVQRGYRGATFAEAVRSPPAEKTLAVTFDDGYRSVLEDAFPLLSELGLPATVFVTTDFVGSEAPMVWPGIEAWIGGLHEHELVPLSWPELGRLTEGGWEVGSHTRTHPFLTRLDDTELVSEVLDSRRRCEEMLGAPCQTLAYPYGDVDGRVVRAVQQAGYAAACIVTHRLPRPEPMRWPRIGIYHRDGPLVFRMKVSPTVRKLRRTPAWSLLEGSRRAVERALRS